MVRSSCQTQAEGALLSVAKAFWNTGGLIGVPLAMVALAIIIVPSPFTCSREC